LRRYYIPNTRMVDCCVLCVYEQRMKNSICSVRPKIVANLTHVQDIQYYPWVKELLQTPQNGVSYASTKWAMFPELVKVLSYGLEDSSFPRGWKTVTQDKGE
jgi:hypothetical protein